MGALLSAADTVTPLRILRASFMGEGHYKSLVRGKRERERKREKEREREIKKLERGE
jgi:hypothetical protein